MKSVALLLIIVAAIISDARKTYPGFTVFDNNKGEYIKVTGPILGKVKISISKLPPYKTSDIVSLYAEVIPTEPINSLFVKGKGLYDDFILWSEDGTNNACYDLPAKFACPWKPGVKYWINSTQNLGSLGTLAGPYSGSAEVFTIDSNNKKVRVIGIEGAIQLNYG